MTTKDEGGMVSRGVFFFWQVRPRLSVLHLAYDAVYEYNARLYFSVLATVLEDGQKRTVRPCHGQFTTAPAVWPLVIFDLSFVDTAL